MLFNMMKRGEMQSSFFRLAGKPVPKTNQMLFFVFAEHAVSQPISMVPARRSGSFPGSGEAGNILSPRSSEASGLGVKMVEYVLGTSPGKDIDPRIRNLVLVSAQLSLLFFWLDIEIFRLLGDNTKNLGIHALLAPILDS